MVEPATKEWWEGPALVEWLTRYVGQNSILEASRNENTRKTLGACRKGKPISIWKADRLLSKFGIHVDEIPAEFRCEPPVLRTPGRAAHRGYPQAFRDRVLAYLHDGHGVPRTAAHFNVSTKSIRKWDRDAR